MLRLPALVAVLCLTAACAGPADPDPEAQERFRSAAAPLLRAHERLDEYDDAVAEGGDYARARALWPEVAEEAGHVLETYDPAIAPLDPSQRAALVGYAGGLRVGLEAWEQVDGAIRGDQVGAEADVDARAGEAREHMRFLDRLRAEAFGTPRRG